MNKANDSSKIKLDELTDQFNQFKNQFLSTMSHELIGPIANIISSIDVLKSENNCDGAIQNQLLEAIAAEGYRALSIIKNSRHYVELDTKEFQQTKAAVYLSGFLEKLKKQYTHEVKENVSFTCQLLHPINRVTFDFMHSLEVLRIIINNAIKYTERGAITLSASLLAPMHIRFTLKDTGPGIDKLYLDNIFKTFLHSEFLQTEKSYVKTGLKLPLARRIAELAGGTLQVESVVGVGTTIYFDIPYLTVTLMKNGRSQPLDDLAEEDYSALTHAAEDFFPFHVLLVEDDPTTAFLETKVLKQLGCTVVCADTACKAIEIVNKQNFDLIFIDITLPDMTGVALVDAIKPILPDATQMVALTSHASDQDHEYFLKKGMMTMLGKPLTESDFKRFFQGYLRMLDHQEE